MTLLRKNLAVTCSYYAAFISLGLCLAVIGPTLPALAEQTQTPLNALGIIFTVREFGFILTALRGVKLFDKLSGNVVMGAAICLGSLLMAVIPIVPWLWALLFSFLVLGSLMATVDIGGNTLLVWMYRQRVAPYMNGLHFFFGIGAFISPLIVAHVLKTFGSIQWAYWIIALIIFPVGLNLMRLPSPQPYETDKGTEAEKIPYGMVILLAVLLGLYVGVEVAYGGWISTYAVLQQLASPAGAAIFASVYWGAFTVGRLLAIPTAIKVSPLVMIAISFGGAFLCAFLLLLFPTSLVLLWVVTVGFGFFTGPIFATVVSFAGQLMKLSARLTGLMFLGSSFGAMSLPWMVGALFPTMGASALMAVIVVALSICLVVLGVVVNVHRRKESVVENEVVV